MIIYLFGTIQKKTILCKDDGKNKSKQIQDVSVILLEITTTLFFSSSISE